MARNIPQTRRQRFERAILKHPDLIAYWKCNETEGTTARNYAPAQKNSYNGSILNSLNIGQTGYTGRSFSNDGSTSKELRVSNTGGGISPSVFTIGFLVKMQSTGHAGGGTNIVFMNSNFSAPPSGTGFYFRHNGTTGANIEFGQYFSDVEVKYETSITANTWTFMCVTFDGDTRVVYKNGVSQNSSTSGATFTPRTAGSTQIFSGFGGINGSLQHIFMMDNDLSASEVTKLARILGVA